MHNATLSSLMKEENSVICNDVDGPGKYYTKRNKPGTESPKFHVLTYMWNVKQLYSLIQGTERLWREEMER
jgi:hypothetical protein